MEWLGGLSESLVNGENDNDDDKNKKKVLHERGFSKLQASRAKNALSKSASFKTMSVLVCNFFFHV